MIIFFFAVVSLLSIIRLVLHVHSSDVNHSSVFLSLPDTCVISGESDDGEPWSHTKRTVPGDRTKYVIELGDGNDVTMTCAYGTAFSQETCDCTVRMIPKKMTDD